MADKDITLFSKMRKSEFDLVYSKGQNILSEKKTIVARFLLSSSEEKTGIIKIGISISAKAGKSVWRNRLRRLVRSSLWLEKESLTRLKNSIDSDLLIVFSPYQINQYNRKKIESLEVQNAVNTIIKKVMFTIATPWTEKL